LQAKFFKGTEEIQIKINVLWTTVLGQPITFACCEGSQNTVEEALWTYDPHAVLVRNG
jgi:hypothetical protein